VLNVNTVYKSVHSTNIAHTEPVFVNLLRSPGIDSQTGGIDSSAGTTTLFIVLARQAGGIDSRGFLNVYKYGLGIHMRAFITM